MRVYVDPPGHLSQAMFRVARALRRYAPEGISIVNDRVSAEMEVLHIIGPDVFQPPYKPPPRLRGHSGTCYKTAGATLPQWQAFWSKADAVWSYYPDLPISPWHEQNFYLAPLGIDDDFRKVVLATLGLRHGIVTSGYVHGRPAEAIQEPALAADAWHIPTYHLGPEPQGMTIYPARWKSLNGCKDGLLAGYYSLSSWVSGLRYVEGFELPAAEGLACGCRPVMFDRVETQHWFGDHAIFVPEMEKDES